MMSTTVALAGALFAVIVTVAITITNPILPCPVPRSSLYSRSWLAGTRFSPRLTNRPGAAHYCGPLLLQHSQHSLLWRRTRPESCKEDVGHVTEPCSNAIFVYCDCDASITAERLYADSNCTTIRLKLSDPISVSTSEHLYIEAINRLQKEGYTKIVVIIDPNDSDHAQLLERMGFQGVVLVRVGYQGGASAQAQLWAKSLSDQADRFPSVSEDVVLGSIDDGIPLRQACEDDIEAISNLMWTASPEEIRERMDDLSIPWIVSINQEGKLLGVAFAEKLERNDNTVVLHANTQSTLLATQLLSRLMREAADRGYQGAAATINVEVVDATDRPSNLLDPIYSWIQFMWRNMLERFDDDDEFRMAFWAIRI